MRMAFAETSRDQGAGAPSIELPIVCPACQLVYRVTLGGLQQKAVICAHCGHSRPSADLRRGMPSDLAKFRPSRPRANLTEFPVKE